MEIKEIKKLEKNLTKYYCENCDFKCFQKCDWNRHITRPKHISNVAGNVKEIKKLEKTFFCECGKELKTNAGLWKHKQKCIQEQKQEKENDIEKELTDKDLIMMLIKENSDLKTMVMKVLENGTMNHSHNTTNSHNKAFNLNFFLNETCKNAMNITDFVDSIKLQLSDLMEVGELGFVEGISKIIVKNLNNLDETVRPVHCTDKKREIMYIKEEGEWLKDDDNKSKLKKTIDKIADKNIRLLPEFREKYPDYKDSSSKTSAKYDKMMTQVMETDENKKEKIIHNISKATTIREK
jgi:hypothetical protein